MKKLSFIGIGPPKTASTWVADNLRKHPGVFIPKSKELQYFNREIPIIYYSENWNYKKGLDWYHGFFKDAKPAQIWGEVSTMYYNSENAPLDIYEYNFEVKIIITLRHPVKKLVSYFRYLKQFGVYEPDVTLSEAISKNDYFVKDSFYAPGLKRYLDQFPREQILILTLEEIQADPKTSFKRLTDFLDLEEFYPTDLANRSNSARSIRIKWLSHLMNTTLLYIQKKNIYWIIPLLKKTGLMGIIKFIQLRIMTKPGRTDGDVDESILQKLHAAYGDDIEEVETLLQRDLSSWKIQDR